MTERRAFAVWFAGPWMKNETVLQMVCVSEETANEVAERFRERCKDNHAFVSRVSLIDDDDAPALR